MARARVEHLDWDDAEQRGCVRLSCGHALPLGPGDVAAVGADTSVVCPVCNARTRRRRIARGIVAAVAVALGVATWHGTASYRAARAALADLDPTTLDPQDLPLGAVLEDLGIGRE